ncbi:MAG: hypothetical protein K2G07_00525 [Muribaculaceae bacterium]|nr:hypothetical protein [Muribaculaceae bacterium]
MIQKCPECGTWCETEEETLMERFSSGVDTAGELGGDILGGIGRIFGKSGEKIGRNVGKFAGYSNGLISGLSNTLFGDSYNFICPECGHEWSCDSEEEDQSEEYYHIQEIIQLVESMPNDEAELHDYITELGEKILEEKDHRLLSILYDTRSCAHWMLDEYNEAQNDINQSLKIIDDAHSRGIRGVYKYDAAENNPTAHNLIDAIRDLTSIYEEDYQESSLAFIDREIIANTLDECTNMYVGLFRRLPASQRRFICFTDSIKGMGNHILVLPLGRVPEGIHFPGGLPQKNVIYEVHPFKPDHYVSLDNFEFDMFKDKLMEFQWIMENLGASKISISIDKDAFRNTTENSNRNYGGEAGYNGISAKGKYGKNETSDNYEDLHLYFEENSKFELGNEPPRLPDISKLVWYPHSEDWKLKVDGRLSGRRTTIETIFESKADYSISESLARELEAEMKYLSSGIKGSASLVDDFHISASERHAWKVKVEFHPLSAYKKNIEQPVGPQTILTEGERDYLTTYQEFIREGEITDRERKLLSKISSQAGLSAARVAELELIAGTPIKKKWWKIW